MELDFLGETSQSLIFGANSMVLIMNNNGGKKKKNHVNLVRIEAGDTCVL